LARRADRQRHQITGLIGILGARHQRARLIAAQGDKGRIERAPMHPGQPHRDAGARMRIGQRNQGVDVVGSLGIAGVLVEEKDAAGLGTAGGTAGRIRSDILHAGSDLRVIALCGGRPLPDEQSGAQEQQRESGEAQEVELWCVRLTKI
jgi:hypothetical protein